jgi:hypothetical protein
VVKREIKLTSGGGSRIDEALPVRVGRRMAAAIVTGNFFPVSHRTLERWPLNWRHVNGRALVKTSDLLAEAQRRVDEAPEVLGGHQ